MFFTCIPLLFLRNQLSENTQWNLVTSQHVTGFIHEKNKKQKGGEKNLHPSLLLPPNCYSSLPHSLTHSFSVCLSLYAAFSAPPSKAKEGELHVAMATATCSLSLASEEQHYFGNQTRGWPGTELSVFTDPTTSPLCLGQRGEKLGSQERYLERWVWDSWDTQRR